MSKTSESSPITDPSSLKLSFNALSINNSPSTDFFSSTVTGSEITSSSCSKISDIAFAEEEEIQFKDVKVVSGEEFVESGKSSFCSVSNSDVGGVVESNGASFRTVCQSKPHKGNDARWDAIQRVRDREGELGLGQFKLMKKLGFGDIGSVYLAELRRTGCLFAMKVMDRGMLASRKKVVRAETERDILSMLDHPFLPTLYSHFETEKFSCLLMEFCSGGDLHLLRQRQPGKCFSEEAAR